MLYEDEIELKGRLDSVGIRYGIERKDWIFDVDFIDNKGMTVISRGIYDTPISALRSLSPILTQTKLPIDDVTVVLRLAYNIVERTAVCFDGIELSPYLYFKKTEVSVDDSKDSVVESK